jgi:hypothetical protein
LSCFLAGPGTGVDGGPARPPPRRAERRARARHACPAARAGRYLDAPFALTRDGIEQTLAANYWGHAELALMWGAAQEGGTAQP